MTSEANAVLSAAEAVALSFEAGWSHALETRLVRLRSAVIQNRVADRRILPAPGTLERHAVTPPTIALAAYAIRARSAADHRRCRT